jgi:hypothetical protein
MFAHLINYFDKLTLTAWIALLMPFVLIVTAFIIYKTISRPVVKWGILFILLVCFMRVVLFGNPVAWAVYNRLLPVELIDWRHHDVIACEGTQYLKPTPDLRYLAVGSSQTSVIFNKYASLHSEFSIFSLAGLSPLDLYAYCEEIVRRKPQFVLLNLSEFDMARNPELASSKWSPFSLHDIIELKSVIDTSGYFTSEEKQLMYDLFFSKYLPEYKYSFVYKDLFELPYNRSKMAAHPLPAAANDSISLAVHLKYLGELSEKYIPFNMYYLNKAVQFLNNKKVPVIIIEGQYNPLAYKPYNMALNQQVNKLLKNIASTDPMNVFLTRDEIPGFVQNDYRDGYHVKEEAGFRYAEKLVSELDSGVLKFRVNKLPDPEIAPNQDGKK